MQIKPIGDKVLVREDVQPEKIGGVYLPDGVGDETWECFSGVVVGVGPDNPDVTIGQRVVMDQWIGIHHEIEGDGYRLLERDEVLAVLEAE